MSVSPLATVENPCMPEMSVSGARTLQTEGYARLGRAFAILTVDGKLLTALHSCDGTNGHPKKGLYGPISETVAGRVHNGQIAQIETMASTFARCLFEEVGVQPSSLPLRYGHDRPAPNSIWPLGNRRNLFAQTGVLFLDPGFDYEQFAGNFTPTVELGTIAFMSIGQFLKQDLRMGAKTWAEQLYDGSFIKPTIPLIEAQLHDSESNQGYVDLRFDELEL